MEFGKNRVQYDDDRVWSMFRFQKFDTYFYEQGRELATYASSYAYQELLRLEKSLDYNLQNKARLIVFNDLSDVKETNIGLITDNDFNTGGVTHVIDNKIFVYFNGNHNDFNKQISKGLSQVIIKQIMYGESISSEIKNSYVLNFPKWYVDGLISYLSEDWNATINQELRSGILSDEFEKFNKLSEEEQLIVGHSIWKYITDVYGKNKIAQILYMSQVNRSVESGFLFVLGITYEGLIADWYTHYSKLFKSDEVKQYTETGHSLLRKNKAKKRYDKLSISPDGNFAAYTSNEMGKVKIRLMNLNNGKTKTIFKYGYKLNDKVDYKYPILAWSPVANNLSVIYEEKDKNVLKTYVVEEKKWRQKRYLMNFEKVLSINYNNKANELVMSAIVKGQSDIFVYNLGANSIKQITNDIYDDHNPYFVNNSEYIIYASNNPYDSLSWDIATKKNVTRDTIKPAKNRDIFLISANKSNSYFKRITNTPYIDENYPIGIGYNEFSFLSNQSGIYNKTLAKFDSVISYIDTTTHYRYITRTKPITNYFYNVLSLKYTPGANKTGEVIKVKDNYKLFIRDIPDYSSSVKVDQSRSWYFSQKIRNIKKQDSLRILKDSLSKIKPEKDSITENKKEKREEIRKKSFKVVVVGNPENKSEDEYKRQSDDSSEDEEVTSLKKEEKTSTAKNIFKAKNNYTQFFINKLTSQVDFNYMNFSYQPFINSQSPIYLNQGFNAFIKIGVMDLLEDRRITGGVKVSPNLRNNEYFLNYTYLEKRWDKEVTLHRNVYESYSSQFRYKHFIHEAFYKVSFPINRVLSWRNTINIRNLTTEVVSYDRNSLFEEGYSSNRAGLKTEIVFDASINPEINTYYGSRGKIWAEYFQPVSDLDENTFIIGLDYRKYFKITKNLIWANRIAASTSFGTQPLIYYMGGVDNWLTPKFNQNIQIDKTQNYAYQTLATNMRGFDQNIRNGNSFFAINSEIRWPIFRFFSNKPVKTNFFKQFMIVGFGDIGTAWTGLNPYSDENALYRHVISQNPITVTVINQNDPIVGGFGFGLRSQLFGYYVRTDWAWGVQNGYLGDRKFYLSLSLDF